MRTVETRSLDIESAKEAVDGTDRFRHMTMTQFGESLDRQVGFVGGLLRILDRIAFFDHAAKPADQFAVARPFCFPVW